MANVTAGKKRLLAIAVVACLCAVIAAVPAYGLWYVHGEEHVADNSGLGVVEVACTLDATAQGGGVHAGLVFVPAGSTAADCLDEMIVSSESQNGLDAIHNYEFNSLADYLADKPYEVTVYKAGSQEPGTHVTYDSEAQTGEDVTLERYDSVVFTLE